MKLWMIPLFFAFFVSAGPLDELLKKVMIERALETEEFKKREQKFGAQKNQQKILLNKAILELRKEERLAALREAEYSKNEKELAVLENELDLAAGVLGELFGVVKQTAGDFRGHILNSVVSAEIVDRENFISQVASRKKLPTTAELRRLWFEIQREMTEQGKVTRFSADVMALDGNKSQRLVTRVGGFNLVSDGKYLNYKDGRIADLPKQPQRRFTRHIKKLEKAKEGYTAFALDPGRGSLISLLIRSPSLWERLKQGGWVGVVIICVFLAGLALALERWLVLRRENFKITAQLNTEAPQENNPLGEIMQVYEKNKNLNLESLELKLEEIIIGYLPKIERGIGTIKIFAVLSPLLGLLGTVAGMIITFQAITLYGTGDPKIMAGGISQALMTTIMGLCCAIPLLLVHNFISYQAKKLTQILEERTAGLLAQKMISKG